MPSNYEEREIVFFSRLSLLSVVLANSFYLVWKRMQSLKYLPSVLQASAILGTKEGMLS